MRQRQSSSASSSRSADEQSADEQPAGGWVLRSTPKHHCVLPKIDARTFLGSVWQCGECHQYWVVKERTVDRGLSAGVPSAEKVKGFVRISRRRYEQLRENELGRV